MRQDMLTTSEYLSICLSKWRWFAASILCALALATVYLLVTPPQYLRTASILIKDTDNSKGASSSMTDISQFSSMGLFAVNTNVNNELSTINTRVMVHEVVERLKLDMTYTTDAHFRKNTLYGPDLPLTVAMLDLADNDNASLSILLSDDFDTFTLSDFSLNREKLTHAPEQTGAFGDTITSPIGSLIIYPNIYYKPAEDQEQEAINVVRTSIPSTISACINRLTASIDNEKTTIINLSYRDVSAQRADDFLNTLIAVYNENWIRDKNQITVSSSEFIRERLAVIEDELGNVDSDISSYKSEHLIPDVQAVSNMYMSQANEANSQILDLNNQLYAARHLRSILANEANSTQLLPANTIGNSAAIERQITEYNEKMLQRNSLIANSSASNPLIIDLDKALAALREAIITSIDNQIVDINSRIKAFRANEQQNTRALASNPTQAKYLLSVERQQKVKESLYLYLLQKREENELSQAFTAYNTRTIEPPTGELRPVAPKRVNILLAAILAGLLVPFTVVFITEANNNKIRSRKDMRSLSIPFLGEIPYCTIGKKKGVFGHRKHADVKAVVVRKDGRDIANEAFRVLRTNLEFLVAQSERSNVIVITSFNPGSGKSFVTVNLAIALAIKEKRVLLIDGDLRHGSSSEFVNSPKPGLTEFLCGKVDDSASAIVKAPWYEHLDVMPIGMMPPNPTELLFSPRLQELVAWARQHYDYVLIDCPPVEMLADTQIIEKLTDRTIFVVRAGLLNRNMLPELEQMYSDKKYKNMVTILNATNAASSRV